MVEIRTHSPCELILINPSGTKFVAGVFRNVFQERFTWKAVIVDLFLAQLLQCGRSSQGNNLLQATTPQGKPWSILCKLQCSIVSLVKFSFS